MANDFRHGAVTSHWLGRGWESSVFSLDWHGAFLLVLPGDHRLSTHIPPALLADAADVSDAAANHFPYHAPRCDCAGLGLRRRTIVRLVAPWCVFCPFRSLDDFPSTRQTRPPRASTRTSSGGSAGLSQAYCTPVTLNNRYGSVRELAPPLNRGEFWICEQVT